MKWMRQVPASSNKVKIVLLSTFLSCLTFSLINCSWQSHIRSRLFPHLEEALLAEDVSLLPPSSNITKPTRPAIVAAARADKNLSWMVELADR